MSSSSTRSADAQSTPARLGYAMPAEWEPHQGTWLTWPHNPDTWPGHLPQVEMFYLDLIAAIARDETVWVLVNPGLPPSRAERMVRERDLPGDIRFLTIATNDAWCRDYGPTVLVRRGGSRALPSRLCVDWEYNAWGGKYPPYDADNAAASQMASALNLTCVAGGMVIEGGSLDGNGQGWMMTTASCLLNHNRNPGADRARMEQRLGSMLGASEVLWLGGSLPGDDTDGHIDNLVRFVDPTTVVAIQPDASYGLDSLGLTENWHQLTAWRSADGRSLVVKALPLANPQKFQTAHWPASYANFYITNGSVLVPSYHCPQDDEACEVLASCFPTRRIVPVDCTYAIRGLGAIHCLTQQVPAEPK